LRAGDAVQRRAQILGDLFRLHHGGAPFGQRRLLAGFGCQTAELLDRVAQPFRLAARPLDLGAMIRDGVLARAPLVPQPRHLGGVAFDAAIGVEQGAMGCGVDEGTLVVLPVDFHQCRAERAQHLDADRLVVDEGAGAAVGELHAPHDQLVFASQIVFRQQPARRMILRQVESGDHLALLGALAHHGGVAARAERQRESVEQDRFAGAGLAGQRGEASTEIDVQAIDQDDVAD
jgi:hypothetical protein